MYRLSKNILIQTVGRGCAGDTLFFDDNQYGALRPFRDWNLLHGHSRGFCPFPDGTGPYSQPRSDSLLALLGRVPIPGSWNLFFCSSSRSKMDQCKNHGYIDSDLDVASSGDRGAFGSAAVALRQSVSGGAEDGG